MIAFPSLPDSKGIPQLTQNRQFQWFSNPTYIFPVVPASTVTLLKEKGHDVIWLDCIAEGISYPKFLEIIL